jgi:hypothetical protein
MKRNPLWAVAAIVGVSFAARTGLAWLRATPALFPDEYIYASVGRSFAESGQPSIRGASAHFPALLQPILTAPAWLIDDVGAAFRTVQAIGALAMSLAAFPAFLIARRLGVGVRVSLALAALTVLVPDLLYSSFVSSEPFAYPLVLVSVYAAMRALAAPARGNQLLFVGAAALATLTRMQFAVLPVVFALATVVVGARERRLRTMVRDQRLPLALFGLAAAATLAAGPARSVGIYGWLLGFHAGPAGILHWAALDAMVLAYAAGWIVVPGALLGLWLTLARPRSTEELAFGTVAVLLLAAILVEAGLLQASLDTQKVIQERYVFYAVPLLGICFAVYATRGWPLRVHHLALAAALILVSVRVPLSGYTVVTTVSGSPILFGMLWLTRELGRPGDASALVAAAVGLMTAVAVLASRRPRLGTPLVLGLALLATGAASAGAVVFDVQNSVRVRKAFLPSDPSWVDAARVGPVTLLEAYSGGRTGSLQELFWNRSITRVALLPGAFPFDSFRVGRARIGPDGSLSVDGRPLTGPLLVDTYGSTLRLRDARLLETGPTAALWVPAAGRKPRLSLYAAGRYADGWLAASGPIMIWPNAASGRVAGWLSMRLSAPFADQVNTIRFRQRGRLLAAVRVQPGAPRTVRIPVCSLGRATVSYRASTVLIAGGRPASVKATAPVFRPDASAC